MSVITGFYIAKVWKQLNYSFFKYSATYKKHPVKKAPRSKKAAINAEKYAMIENLYLK